jgi:hypothetical protein
VEPALAAQFMFEVFDRVGDEGFCPRDASVVQRLVEQAVGRPTNGRPAISSLSPG